MPSSTTAADQVFQTRFGIFETGSRIARMRAIVAVAAMSGALGTEHAAPRRRRRFRVLRGTAQARRLIVRTPQWIRRCPPETASRSSVPASRTADSQRLRPRYMTRGGGVNGTVEPAGTPRAILLPRQRTRTALARTVRAPQCGACARRPRTRRDGSRESRRGACPERCADTGGRVHPRG